MAGGLAVSSRQLAALRLLRRRLVQAVPLMLGVVVINFVLIHLDYHEVPADVRPAMNRRIFAALKRGGSYGVVDHSAKEGTGDTVAKTLHRMDKTLVIKEATAAGFRLEKEGQMLSRPEDTRDFSVVKERDKSDRFVLKFVKP